MQNEPVIVEEEYSVLLYRRTQGTLYVYVLFFPPRNGLVEEDVFSVEIE